MKFLYNINIRAIHILSWCCYLILLVVFYSSTFSLSMAVYQALQVVILHAAIFYLNTMVLMPRLMERRKYFIYFITILSIVLVSVGILYTINMYIKPFGEFIPKGLGERVNLKRLEGLRGGRPSLIWRNIIRHFPPLVAVLLFSVVYRMFMQKVKEEKREASLINEHLLSEMKFLKSQVNPHFLFNSLNNIYTLVHLKHEQAPVMLMKLSEMLRYMLYECNDEWVPLDKEVLYIENYIELQQLKTEDHQRIITNFDEVDYKTLIPPLLLIPFIENSFKHSRIENALAGWVTMSLSSSKNHIHFEITNTLPNVPIAKDVTGGIGLENVKRRLELLYPNKYELKIKKTEEEFIVVLNINNE